MTKILLNSLREYKKDAIKTPIIVIGEVIMECIIPFFIARLVNLLQAGKATPHVLWTYGRFCEELKKRFIHKYSVILF